MGNEHSADFSGSSGGQGDFLLTRSFANYVPLAENLGQFPLLPNAMVNYKFKDSKYDLDIKGRKVTCKLPKVDEIMTAYCNECMQAYSTIKFVELVNEQNLPTSLLDFTNARLEYAISLYEKVYGLPSLTEKARRTLAYYFGGTFELFGQAIASDLKLKQLREALLTVETKYTEKLLNEVLPNTVITNNKPLDSGSITWFNTQKAGRVLDKTIAEWFIKRANSEMEIDIKVHFAGMQIRAMMFNADPLMSDARFRMSLEDARWNEYDELIKKEVTYYNNKFAATAGFVPLDWRYVKAMVWTEIQSGPAKEAVQWKDFPLQIGRYEADPGYKVISEGLDNSDFITPPELRQELQTKTNVKGKNNIRAGIAYLYTKAIDGKVGWREIVDNPQILSYKIQNTDRKGLDDIAKRLETTSENIIRNTSGMTKTTVLKVGTELKYQKAHLEKFITGWLDWQTAMRNYNSKTPNKKGDTEYVDKFTRAYQIIVSRTPR
ncbi:MAG: hypothetical protein LUM44_20085 [Pyrinomonadaceae bacterium]|nr:hypothetical protein [Pyrinomonadaceae bacterium]